MMAGSTGSFREAGYTVGRRSSAVRPARRRGVGIREYEPARRLRVAAVLAGVVALVAAGSGLEFRSGGLPPTASAKASAPPDIATQLRYIGRDTLTGRPTAVDDRFIAELEGQIERYGKDEREAIPP